METQVCTIFSQCWTVLKVIVSVLPCSVIYKFISSKLLVQLTIIDLLHRDAIDYVYLLSAFSKLEVFPCIAEANSDHYMSINLGFVLLGHHLHVSQLFVHHNALWWKSNAHVHGQQF